MIARKYNLITRLGRILDPLADKLMIFSALVCVSMKNLLPWWITIIYFVKEIVQTDIRRNILQQIKRCTFLE